MRNFSSTTVVGQKYTIMETNDRPDFYGFQHQAIAIIQEHEIKYQLIAFHSHFDALLKTKYYPSELFLKLEIGVQDTVIYGAFPKEDGLYSYYQHLKEIEKSPNDLNLFFLDLIEWIYILHQKGLSIPYLNPDMIFIQNGHIKILDPLQFDIRKMEGSVWETKRFFSPNYLCIVFANNPQVASYNDYYPVLILALEAYLKKKIPWNRSTYQIDRNSIHEPFCKELLELLDDIDKEEDAYNQLKNFFTRRLQIGFKIASNIEGKCILESQIEGKANKLDIPFPSTQYISYDSQAVKISFPEYIEYPKDSDIQYKLIRLSNSPDFYVQDVNSVTLNNTKLLNRIPCVSIEYEQIVKFRIELEPKEACQMVEINSSRCREEAAVIPITESTKIKIYPQKGYKPEIWEIDNEKKKETKGQTIIFLQPSSQDKKIKIYFRKTINLWIIFLFSLLLIAILFTSIFIFKYNKNIQENIKLIDHISKKSIKKP